MYRIVKYETIIGDRYTIEQLNNDGIWRVIFRYNKGKGRCSFDTLKEVKDFVKVNLVGELFVSKQEIISYNKKIK